jgi:hypothetical protein
MPMTIYLLTLSCVIGWLVITTLTIYIISCVIDCWGTYTYWQYENRILDAVVLHCTASIMIMLAISVSYSGLRYMGVL